MPINKYFFKLSLLFSLLLLITNSALAYDNHLRYLAHEAYHQATDFHRQVEHELHYGHNTKHLILWAHRLENKTKHFFNRVNNSSNRHHWQQKRYFNAAVDAFYQVLQESNYVQLSYNCQSILESLGRLFDDIDQYYSHERDHDHDDRHRDHDEWDNIFDFFL